MDPNIDEVTKDLLHLVGAACPLKLMLFRTRADDPTGAFTRVLKRCVPADHFRSSDRLFLGIPRYSEWLEAKDKSALGKHVYLLPKGSNAIELQAKTGWWKGH